MLCFALLVFAQLSFGLITTCVYVSSLVLDNIKTHPNLYYSLFILSFQNLLNLYQLWTQTLILMRHMQKDVYMIINIELVLQARLGLKLLGPRVRSIFGFLFSSPFNTKFFNMFTYLNIGKKNGKNNRNYIAKQPSYHLI